MKTNKVTYVAMILAFVLMASATNLIAQKWHAKEMHKEYLNLTDDQEKKLDELRTPHMKTMQDFRADMNIKEAEYEKLMKADKPDMKAINAKIDEISKLHGDMMKERSKHQQDVRALLTDDQKVMFDAHIGMQGKHGMGQMHGMKGGKGMHGKGAMMQQHRHGMGGCKGQNPPPPPPAPEDEE